MRSLSPTIDAALDLRADARIEATARVLDLQRHVRNWGKSNARKANDDAKALRKARHELLALEVARDRGI